MKRTSRTNNKEVRQNFPLRLSPTERAALEEKAVSAGLKLSEYLRQSGLRPQQWQSPKSRTALVPQINRQTYLELAKTNMELRRIGINVNQIAKACNLALKLGESPNVDTDSLMSLSTQLEALESQLDQVRAALIGLNAEPEEDDDWETG